jgi:hypothetical protein
MSTAKCLKVSSFLLFCLAGSTLFAATPAKAISCLEVSTIGKLVSEGSCDLKGVILTYVASHSGFALTDNITIGSLGPAPASNFNFRFQGNPTMYTDPFIGEFKYNLKAPTGKYITNYTSSISSSANGGNNTGRFSLAGAAGTAMATYDPVGMSVGSTKTNNTIVTNDNFVAQVSVTQGGITNFSQNFNFADIPPAPGPLPLAGLGIALGYSRKLRKRIAAS